MSTALLETKDLSVGYGSVPVVKSLSLRVDRGEIVALMGANGAGKTTTLLGLAGCLKPLAGSVQLMGAETHAPLHRRAKAGVRYVCESRSIIRSLSAHDNLRLAPGSPDEGLELFPELKALLKRPAGLLSGGEQQMLALAGALGGEPQLLLVDELSLGLAPIIVHRLFEALRAAADSGVGVLLVEQQVRAALDLADRGYVIRRGRLALEGDAAQLRDRTAEIESTYLTGLDAADEDDR